MKDAELLKELGPGRGQVTLIQELLDQVLDPAASPMDFLPSSVFPDRYIVFLPPATRGQTPPAATAMADTCWPSP